jgi:hypothetical protein
MGLPTSIPASTTCRRRNVERSAGGCIAGLGGRHLDLHGHARRGQSGPIALSVPLTYPMDDFGRIGGAGCRRTYARGLEGCEA